MTIPTINSVFITPNNMNMGLTNNNSLYKHIKSVKWSVKLFGLLKTFIVESYILLRCFVGC